jgi:hypothetical protein
MSDDLKQLGQEAGTRYARAISLGHEDLQLRAVKYLLLRLTVGGLNSEDVDRLRPLARAAFFEEDVTAEVNEVRKSKKSSPLALALADVVAEAKGSKRMAMLGAVLGAHAALGARVDQGAQHGLAEMQGAIVGAAVFETHRLLEQMITTPSWSDFATRD